MLETLLSGTTLYEFVLTPEMAEHIRTTKENE